MACEDAEILLEAERWRRAGRSVAVATVIETFGSAPRPVGSHLVVDDSGRFLGSVSAGCVEAEVVTAALDVIADGAPRVLTFGVADETAWRVGLSCGGRIGVLVATLNAAGDAVLEISNRRIAARIAHAIATPLDGGDPRLIEAGDPREAERGVMIHEGRRWFVEWREPAPRLVIIGAVHLAQSLAPMARLAGFEPIIVDPREAYATRERFPGVHLNLRWPDDALAEIGLDASTALVALTHDPKIDDPALMQALASDCFYIGALGSRATHARRIERLTAKGVARDALARIKAPVGLDIGAPSAMFRRGRRSSMSTASSTWPSRSIWRISRSAMASDPARIGRSISRARRRASASSGEREAKMETSPTAIGARRVRPRSAAGTHSPSVANPSGRSRSRDRATRGCAWLAR